ncbi:hypothetical protein ADJ76_00835 [Schaalia meyeri]|uniref:AbrB/MazE/SpoVT family DNA-binding domain-containing protein n=1 Tax=Schaalia meyeri TaxID=52773 RepID=UPI0006829490|nr:AbrB/MazE/SpoVT family DNA-binding domain-containing protein [Schaalia meyeri]AKU64508.1 hypothetical protein ADJ76_00835 [Schaalia meyeri]SDR84566.1 looped-hinge helix DNA binding domain-containing protein, AbrB family [Schaalia meyeri]
MAPRNPAHIGPGGRGFFGTVTVGTRGQISIPAQARKSLSLEPGDQLVVLTDPAQGLALIPLSLLLAQHADTNPIAALVRHTMAGGKVPPPPNTPEAQDATPDTPQAGGAAATPTKAGGATPAAPTPGADTAPGEDTGYADKSPAS